MRRKETNILIWLVVSAVVFWGTLFFLIAQAVAQTTESDASVDSTTIVQQDFSSGGRHKTKSEIDTTPDVYVPMAPSTAPCRVGQTVGVGWTGFGVGGATSVKDDECNTRETAIVLHNIGVRAVATTYLCQNDAKIKAAFDAAGIRCDLKPPPEVISKMQEYEEEKQTLTLEHNYREVQKRARELRKGG